MSIGLHDAPEARRTQSGVSEVADSAKPKATKKKHAGSIAPAVRELAVREFRYYGSTREIQRRFGISRSDAQDAILLEILKDIRRSRPLQRRAA